MSAARDIGGFHMAVQTEDGATFDERLEAESAAQIPGQQDIDGGFHDPAAEAVPLEELRVDGTAQLGMFDSGGKKPTSASIRLSGGKIELVDGKAFRKGDVIHFEGTAIVREVAQRDKPDPKTGIVVSAEQKHTAQITDIRIAGADG
jgi:hypothetical protein